MPLLALVLACVLLAGCGSGGGNDGGARRTGTDAGSPLLGKDPSAGGEAVAAAAPPLAFPYSATKNTTRLGGADEAADAAAAALAAFPSTAPAQRPPAVTLVDRGSWQAAISAAQLLAAPVRSPVLLTDGAALPASSATALRALRPAGGGRALDGAQLVRVGATAKPGGYVARDLPGTAPAALARAVDALHAAAAGHASGAVVVASQDEPAYAMPAASWAAKSGDPVLWVSRTEVPRDTRAAIAAHGRPRIYLLGPRSVIGERVARRLARLGTVKRISAPDPVRSAVAFARYADGDFGWRVVDPGHGLVFATPRPADAAGAAPLAAAGTFAPLVLIADGTTLPAAVREYLLDIQPGYERDPVRGVYNHGWLIGDAKAISVGVQARIDSLLEIQPVATTPDSP